MTELAKKSCKGCSGEVAPYTADEAKDMMAQLGEGWTLTKDNTRLYKQYPFKGFKGPLKLVNRIAAIADEEGHHPNFHFTWGEVEIEIWTHEAGGLTEDDFILAAKCDEARETQRQEAKARKEAKKSA